MLLPDELTFARNRFRLVDRIFLPKLPVSQKIFFSLARGTGLLSILFMAAFIFHIPGPSGSLAASHDSSSSANRSEPARAKLTRPDVVQFRARAERIFSGPDAQKAFWGVLVEDRDTGQVLYDLNGDHFFTPASNAKIFTTIFALASLGPGYHYHTTLESSAVLDSDGRLHGDLLLVGRGDPDFSNWKIPYAGKIERDEPTELPLAQLADAAVAKGLHEVDGDIVADDSYLPYDPYPAGWSIGDGFFSFGAPIGALTFNENSITVIVSPGSRVGDPATFTIDPPEAAGGVTVRFSTSAASDSPDTGVGRQPGENFIFLRGTIPLGHAPVRVDLAMTDPAVTAGRTLRQLLEARGVRVTGSVRVQHAAPPVSCISLNQNFVHAECLVPAPKYPSVFADHVSPPLIESVRLTNKVSQNLHAELFLRTVAREKAGYGATDAGLWLEQDFLKTAGVPDGDVVLSDGSGLSRDDLVTPRAAVSILRYAAGEPWGPDYISTLPVAGVDGTLEDRMTGTAASGRIFAKTGTLEHVHSLCGFATTLRGEHLVFAMFGNNSAQKGRDSTSELDQLAIAMVETLGKPPARKKK